jgi:hypothetical protein
MRWLYFDAGDPQEAAEHAAVVRSIDDWWHEFASKTHELDDLFGRRTEWDLPAWMQRHLNAISPHLMWEYGAALEGDGHRLVITPECEQHLRPMVQTLLHRAPKLPGWEFYSYRLPEDVQMANQMVAARAGGDLSGTLATVIVGQHNRIDLCYYSAATRGAKDEHALDNAFVATECLMGEELLDKWVGVIAVQRLREPRAIAKLTGRARRRVQGLVPLERLKPTVDAVVASIKDQLPDKPLYVLQPEADAPDSQIKWVGIEVKPTPAEDYLQRRDLLVAISANANLWRAAHEDESFYSERYSRHGETFCYLKLDGSVGVDEEKFPDRASIEDALNETLEPARLGCVIGGGTGLRYSYIDLALVVVDAALPLIRSRLRAGNIARRTWLLFFDAHLAHEWIGVYDDTPAPPGANAPSRAN